MSCITWIVMCACSYHVADICYDIFWIVISACSYHVGDICFDILSKCHCVFDGDMIYALWYDVMYDLMHYD